MSSSTFALVVGALGSGAANVAWTWELGPVRVVAGLFATALVPISLHLWPRVPITGKVTRVVRALVMSYICVAAAVVNLAHSAQLLTTDPTVARPVAENLWLAVLLITAVEGVMVMATLAKRAKPEPHAAAPSADMVAALVTVARLAATAQTRPTPARRRPRPEPVEPATPEPVRPAVRPATGQTPREWADTNWPATGAEIQLATGCSKGYAYKIAAELRAEHEAAS